MSTRITDLPQAETLNGSEVMPLVQNGVTKHATLDFINQAAPAALILQQTQQAYANTVVLHDETEALKTEFEAQYLGSFPAPPVLNNDGSTLTVGAIYWNTSISSMYVWNGAEWTAFSSPSMRVHVQRFSGDGIQTDFLMTLGVSSASLVDVFINGIYQNKNTFTVEDTLISFSEPPPSGSENVEVLVAVATAIGETDASLVSYKVTDDSETVRNVQSKLREWVSVKDFGAVGDGVTDDTAAIQAAIDSTEVSGHPLFVPQGTYIVTSLTVKGRGRIIYGAGKRKSILKGVGENIILTWGRPEVDITGYCDSSTLSEIGISGNALSKGGLVVPGNPDDNATWSVSSRYNNFSNVRIDGIGSGPAIRNAGWGNYYDNVEAWSCLRGLVFGNTSYSVTFSNCTFSGHVNEAILLPAAVSAEPVVFVGCVAQSSGGTFGMVDIQGGRSIEFSGLYTEQIKAGTPAAIRVGASNVGFAIRGMRYSLAGSTETGAKVVHLDGCKAAVVENVSSGSVCHSVLYISGSGTSVSYSGVRSGGLATAGAVVDDSTSGSNFGTDADSGEVGYNKRLVMPGFVSMPSEISIPNDSVYQINFDLPGSRGVLLITGTGSSSKSAMVAFRTGDVSQFATLMAGSSGVSTTSGALSGTTGMAGSLTISTSDTDPKVYIENRTGATRSYSLTLLGNNRGRME